MYGFMIATSSGERFSASLLVIGYSPDGNVEKGLGISFFCTSQMRWLPLDQIEKIETNVTEFVNVAFQPGGIYCKPQA
jgi:hypothetical protein